MIVKNNAKQLKCTADSEIVVSGISGKYPECDNIDEFAEKLYNNEDLVTHDNRRWPKDFFGTEVGVGKVENLDKFDHKFFDVDEKDAHLMDSQIRILLEVVYEAIWDSGTDPLSLSGTNTGLFIGNCFDEFITAYSSIGETPAYRQHIPQTIAHKFNFRGPAMAVDTACASSFTALNEAIAYMRNNRCDNAVVAGINLGLSPLMQLQFFKLNMLSPDGKCKCLDESANGYAKGEAVVAILLQKRSSAKRIYATVIHTKTNNDGYEEMGITFPTWESQRDLMKATYAEAGIDPHDVHYIEAHCTGTQAGDPEEMRAICESMCTENRMTPLLIGAHKSNIGHTEASSGLCAMSKVIICLENELIPANIHYKSPNPKIEGIHKGLLKPILENQKFFGDIVGINNFGFGGSNIHAIVKSPKIRPSVDNKQIVDKIPRLVNICGRDEKAVEYFFEKLFRTPNKITRDLLSLVNDISKTSPLKESAAYTGMASRGFAIIEDRDQSLKEIQNFNIKEVKEKNREVWFVMSGMGTQWSAMAKDLIRINTFEKSIKSLCKIMKTYSIDLWDLLINENENIKDSVMKSFLTIAAIQIALIDLLEELDIKPNGIVGHSIGELTCAYADKCLTAEETILMAYWRAKCINDNIKNTGRMAAIGMSHREAKPICPSDVWIGCDNADDSVTVSGDNKAIDNFLKLMKDKNIFTANVESSGIAFHSPLMYSIGEQLTERLRNVMNDNRKMSSKWVSTHYNNRVKNISAHYFVDNLLYPIYFKDALKQIPRNAIIIEVSPHCLLQPIIKRSLGPEISYVPLMRKKDNNLNLFLSSVGTLYTLGLNPKIEILYPKVEYPVSTGTSMLSSLVKWDHRKSFTVTKYPEFFNSSARITQGFSINLMDKEDSYILGHCIDGRNLYPGTGYLLFAWKQLAAYYNVNFDEIAVEFRDVVLHRATIVHKNGETNFSATVDDKSGEFIISENGSVVVTGRIYALKQLKTSLEFDYILEENSFSSRTSDERLMKKNDIYRELKLRGYDYGQAFKGISKASFDDKTKVKAVIDWTDNWVVFADCMIQMAILGVDSRGLFIPVRIDLLRCDPTLLMAEAKKNGSKLEAVFDYNLRIGVSKGLEYRGVKANLVQRNMNSHKPIVGDYSFSPFDEQTINDNEYQLRQYFRTCDLLAQKIAKKFQLTIDGSVSEEVIRDELKNTDIYENKNTFLYHLLKDIENCDSITKELIIQNKNYLNLNKDLYLKSIIDKSLFDSKLLTVYLNKKSIDLKILEINDTEHLFSGIVFKCYDPYDYDLRIGYQLIHPKPEELSDQMKNSIQTIRWNSDEIPTNVKDLDLIIYRHSNENPRDLKQMLKSIWTQLKSNGFVVFVLRDDLTFAEKVIRSLLESDQSISQINEIQMNAEELGFVTIGKSWNSFGAKILVYRKLNVELKVEKQIIIRITNRFEEWIENLKNEIKTINSRPEGENIWLLANDKQPNGVLGLFNCLRKEPNGQRIRCLLDCDNNGNEIPLDSIVSKDLTLNVIQNKCVGYYKMTLREHIADKVMAEHCFLNTSTRGDLSSLKWFECQHKYWPIGRKDNQMLCHIYYSALNFRDIMLASGRLPADALPGDIALQDCILGLEFAGRDENGNRVMGMIPSKALATTCIVDDPDFLWPIPENWSMEEASTVPCVYSTAYYSLIIRGNLKKGEKVLIHSGSGGVGQAAINICLDMGCEVFITVGSKEKKEFLQKLFPTLTERNFSSSRDLSFKKHVMNQTKGSGVHLVLNSLSDDKLKASLECLATNGRFLEIGKYDMSLNTKIDLSEMIKNKSFHGILLDALFSTDEKTPKTILKDRKRIWNLISDGIRRGTVKPLNRSVFSADKCEEAFRYMSSGKHMGKVVIKIRDEEPIGQRFLGKQCRLGAVPRTVFNPNKVYLITGGLGGFGLELVNWMIEREAKKFVITSRTGPKDHYQYSRLKRFGEMGADVHICTQNSISSEGIQQLLKFCSTVGPIGGIFHLAMILMDSLFENQTDETFSKVCETKSDSFLLLDRHSRELCPDLDYFVSFSSGVASRGNAGQTSYGYSNAVLDRICENRQKEGLKALSIQWGVIGDVGVVVDTTGSDEVIIAGTVAQRIPSCLQTLDQILQSNHSICISFIKSEPKFSSADSRTDLIKRVAHTLGIEDITQLDPNTKLLKLGMDSLMAVEIQQTIERDFNVVLPPEEVRDMTIARIIQINSETNTETD